MADCVAESPSMPVIAAVDNKAMATAISIQETQEEEPVVPNEEVPQVAKPAEPAPAKVKKEKKPKENRQNKAGKAAAPELPFHQHLGETLRSQSQREIPTICSLAHAEEKPDLPAKANSSPDVRPSRAGLLAPPLSTSQTRSSSRSSQRPASEKSVSTGSLSDLEARDPSVNPSLKSNLYTLEDFKRLEAINSLVAQYSTVSHMSVRDPSYSFWLNQTRTAAVHFKLLNKVAVLAGDPLCPPSAMPAALEEFERYCRKAGWKTSIIGASEEMLEVAKLKKWPVMRFGTEKVLNPMTNEVLLGKSGKRTVSQCKQLLAKGGLSLHIYLPEQGRDHNLEAELTKLYDDWRGDRNTNRDCQAFITVFEMFSLPNLMTFVYTRDADGVANGFAALRKMGGGESDGSGGSYHIDPFIQTASAPRGTSDLLIFASLAYLNTLGATYLGLGHEPVSSPDAIWNMNSLIINATRRVYKHIFGRLPVGGKETFNSRWKPDKDQEAGLYLIFVGRKTPSPKHLLAMTHFANISLRSVLKADWKDFKQELSNHHFPGADPNMLPYAGAAGMVEAPRDRPLPALLKKSASAPAATAIAAPVIATTARG